MKTSNNLNPDQHMVKARCQCSIIILFFKLNYNPIHSKYAPNTAGHITYRVDIVFASQIIQGQKSRKSIFREYLASYWSDDIYYENCRLNNSLQKRSNTFSMYEQPLI